MEHVKKAIRDAGVANVAKALGVKTQVVFNWIERGVPVLECARLEAVMGGKLTRQQMRPNDWQQIWPELAEVKKSGKARSQPA